MNILEVPTAHNNLVSQSILLKSVSIIGTGHLGAHFAMGLSKLGVPEIYLYDPDQVEKRNVSGTPFNVDDIGEFKVEALRKLLLNGNLEKKFIHVNKSRVEHAKDLVQITDVYVVATDSIESRIKILEAIEEQTKENTAKKYLIDLRSRSKIAEVHALPLFDEALVHWYKLNMKAKENDPTPEINCNEANIVQNTLFAVSLALELFCKTLEAIFEPRISRLHIEQYSIQHLQFDRSQIEIEWNKILLKRKCPGCEKKHRSMKRRDKCIADAKDQCEEEKQEAIREKKLPTREELFVNLGG